MRYFRKRICGRKYHDVIPMFLLFQCLASRDSAMCVCKAYRIVFIFCDCIDVILYYLIR